MPKEILAISAEPKMEIREYQEPALGKGQVRVKSEFGAAKHGTELSIIKGHHTKRGDYDKELGAFKPKDDPGPFHPCQVGNMFVGTVTEVGPGVAGLSAGDRVLAYGPFRETHTVSEHQCWKMPERLSWKTAVCLDPADFAMAAVRDGKVRIGDAVVVFGMGALGLMVVQIAKLSGAFPVIAVDPLPNRRKAAERYGADLILDPTAGDVALEIRKATGHRGADVAIEYSGSLNALQAAIRSVAFGGNLVAGAFSPPYGPGLDFGAEAHHNRPNIIFSRACSEPNREHPRWDEQRIYAACWKLMTEGKLTGESIVEPVVAFEELITAYPKIATDPGSNIKLGVKF